MTRAYILENLEIIKGFFGICLGNAAPGSEAENHFRSLMTAAKEAQEILDQTPRLMTEDAFRSLAMGCGWLEWSPQEGIAFEDALFGVAWVGSEMLMMDDTGCPSYGRFPDGYNRRGGFRVWTDRPTDAQRKEAAWDD